MFTKIYTFEELKRINDGRTAISGHHYIDTWGNIYIGTDYRKLKSYSSSTAVWGNITGDIDDQSDLMSLLGTKVESVTGLNTDNTDPLNPVVQISVDGVTITGDGTPGSPLVAIISGLVDSVTDDGNGVVFVDNTDPQNPIINFNGVNVDGVTISGDGTVGNPLSVIPETTYTVTTTNATVTTLQTIAIPNNTGMIIRTFVKCRKSAGAGVGTVGDVNAYVRTVKAKNVAGTVTIGVISSDYTSEDIAPFNATFVVSGTNVLIRVTGSVNNTVDWEGITTTL